DERLGLYLGGEREGEGAPKAGADQDHRRRPLRPRHPHRGAQVAIPPGQVIAPLGGVEAAIVIEQAQIAPAGELLGGALPGHLGDLLAIGEDQGGLASAQELPIERYAILSGEIERARGWRVGGGGAMSARGSGRLASARRGARAQGKARDDDQAHHCSCSRWHGLSFRILGCGPLSASTVVMAKALTLRTRALVCIYGAT